MTLNHVIRRLRQSDRSRSARAPGHPGRFTLGDWRRGIVTSGFIILAVWLLVGCEAAPSQASQHASSQPDSPRHAIDPKHEDFVYSLGSFQHFTPTAIAVAPNRRVYLAGRYRHHRGSAIAEQLPDGSLREMNTGWNQWDGEPGTSAVRSFVHLAALAFDGDGQLWLLDSGNPERSSRVVPGGLKLVQINPETERVVRAIYLDHRRGFSSQTDLIDMQIDRRSGLAYLADGSRGVVAVVDLASGAMQSVALVPPQKQMQSTSLFSADNSLDSPATALSGIALSPDSQTLYLHTTDWRLMRIPTAAIRHIRLSDASRRARIVSLTHPGQSITAIRCDHEGRLVLAAPASGAILLRDQDGRFETLAASPALRHVDKLAIAADSDLYTTGLTPVMTPKHKSRRDRFAVGTTAVLSMRQMSQAQRARAIADQHHAEARWYAQETKAAEQLAQESAAQADQLIAQARRVVALARQAQADGAGNAAALRQQALEALQSAEASRLLAESEREAAKHLRVQLTQARATAAEAEARATRLPMPLTAGPVQPAEPRVPSTDEFAEVSIPLD